MNHYFLETRGKEKVNDLIQEGLRSQAYYRSFDPQARLLSKLPNIVFVILGILVIVLVSN